MSRLRSGSGRLPEPCPGPRLAPRASRLAPVAISALIVCGCAQGQEQSTAYDPRVADPPYQVAAGDGRRPDLEDDGREAQIPPPKRAHPVPDDPREPWSPNYGPQAPVSKPATASVSPSRDADLGPVVRGQVPADLPSAFRERLASALDD